jgi:hypothetical protein
MNIYIYIYIYIQRNKFSLIFQYQLNCEILLLAEKLSNLQAVKILIKVFKVILTYGINSTGNHLKNNVLDIHV